MDNKTRHICMLPTRDSLQKTRTHRLKVKGWRKIFHTNGNKKKAGAAMLISDKITFKTKTVINRQRRTLHNDKGVNPVRRYNIHKCKCTQQRSTKIYKANVNVLKGRN